MGELNAKKEKEVETQKELEGLKQSLHAEKQKLNHVINQNDKLKIFRNENNLALQVCLLVLYII